MKRKVLYFVMCLCLVFTMVGCGGGNNNNSSSSTESSDSGKKGGSSESTEVKKVTYSETLDDDLEITTSETECTIVLNNNVVNRLTMMNGLQGYIYFAGKDAADPMTEYQSYVQLFKLGPNISYEYVYKSEGEDVTVAPGDGITKKVETDETGTKLIITFSADNADALKPVYDALSATDGQVAVKDTMGFNTNYGEISKYTK